MFGSGNLFYISDHRVPEKGALVLVSWKNSYSHQEYENATGNYLEAGEALLVDTSPAVPLLRFSWQGHPADSV